MQRITGLHTDVLIIKRDISALLNEKYPELAEARRAERAVYSVRIPDALVGRLQGMLERCNSDGSDRSLTLQEMTDCFLIHFSRSTVQLQPVLDGSKTYPPLTHYVELLKCQLLMHRIKSVNELQNPLRMSHWPGYITALEEVGHSFLSPSYIILLNVLEAVITGVCPVSNRADSPRHPELRR